MVIHGDQSSAPAAVRDLVYRRIFPDLSLGEIRGNRAGKGSEGQMLRCLLKKLSAAWIRGHDRQTR
jgi:hypothetical protein